MSEVKAGTGTESWIIQSASGQQLQAFSINPDTIEVTWFDPSAQGKTKQGKKGAFNFKTHAKATAMLGGMQAVLPTEFNTASVVQL